MRAFAAVATALLATIVASVSAAPRMKPAVGEVAARTETAFDSVTIGQRFHIRYHFTFDPDSLRPLVPKKLNAGTCRLMGVTYNEAKKEKEKNVERIADVTFIPLSIDSSVVPANKFDFLAVNGDTIRAWTDEVRVPIKRIAANAKDLNPLKEQWKAPPNYLLWGGIALAVLVAIAALIWWIRKRRRRGEAEAPAVRLPPEVIALAELERIAALNLPVRGDYKQHYTLVVDALRHYLEARYGVEAMDRTTFELMDVLNRHRVRVDGLEPLLNEADLVKFAKFAPTPESAAQAVSRAREMVIASTPVAATPDPLAPSEPTQPREPSQPAAGASQP
jgi:hypothetical protein